MTRRLRAKPPADERLWESFKKKSIQEAVARLLCRDGVEAVTMDNVASEAGVAKATLYLHFKDKQALLDSVVEAALQPLVQRHDELFASGLAPEKKLAEVVAAYLGYFDQERQLFRVLLYEREVSGAQWRRYRTSRYLTFVGKVSGVIAAGIASGRFRRIDPTKAAVMLVEAATAVVSQRLWEEDLRPVSEDVDLVNGLFSQGIQAARVRSGRAAAARGPHGRA